MTKKTFTRLAYGSVDEFLYGTCPNPVAFSNGITIGGGEVYPEINFTLPNMLVSNDTIMDALDVYQDIITGVLTKAHELYVPGLVVEYETLPEFTYNPHWGIQVHRILRDTMREFEAKHGLKSVIRMTPNDVREFNRPPIMRDGRYWHDMLEIFEKTARDGADILSIESTGGKEINDEAIVNVDLKTSVFALGVLGARDMEFLWSHISAIAAAEGVISGGDSACGFANTAMVLAERGMIPKVYAAVMRAAVTPRALVAIENGAVGPGKDCAYENVYLKAITGTPISLEGKTAACAHFSPIGNIAACAADLWSNESVQQVKLLSGYAPVVSMEQLAYDCRLMNAATKAGHAKTLRDLLVDSDCYLDPQAYIMRPDVAFKIAAELIKTPDPFSRTVNVARLAVDILENAVNSGELQLPEKETRWFGILRSQLDEIPDDEERFIAEMKSQVNPKKYLPEQYGI
ncbi:MAG: methanol--corrinoid methyltransferase [Oscillospiraceae bacterium]|jgi:methanol--5-hydroxybenzimidazolylcobamide Co-methyltransferase|nr:methanol--corrinoid methyltransferase [Oscillospiraceae bacterium]